MLGVFRGIKALYVREFLVTQCRRIFTDFGKWKTGNIKMIMYTFLYVFEFQGPNEIVIFTDSCLYLVIKNNKNWMTQSAVILTSSNDRSL